MSKSTLYKILSVLASFVGILTLGGLGNAAFKYDGIYWVPFIVNAVIAVVLGIKEFKGVNSQIGAKKPDVLLWESSASL